MEPEFARMHFRGLYASESFYNAAFRTTFFFSPNNTKNSPHHSQVLQRDEKRTSTKQTRPAATKTLLEMPQGYRLPRDTPELLQ